MSQQRFAIGSDSDTSAIAKDLLIAPFGPPDIGYCLKAVSFMIIECYLLEGEMKGITKVVCRPELKDADITSLLEFSVPVMALSGAAVCKPPHAPPNWHGWLEEAQARGCWAS